LATGEMRMMRQRSFLGLGLSEIRVSQIDLLESGTHTQTDYRTIAPAGTDRIRNPLPDQMEATESHVEIEGSRSNGRRHAPTGM
jgi:hypothetical protein